MNLNFEGKTAEIIRTVDRKCSEQGSGGFPGRDKRGTHTNRPHKTPEQVTSSVIQHIQSFPAVESHYCRKDTNKVYIDNQLNLQKMYRQYQSAMIEKDAETLASLPTYRDVFNHQFNIEFHEPLKDQCDQCYVFDHILTPEQRKSQQEEHDLHRFNKLRSREILEDDMNFAKQTEDKSVCVACYDMEQNLATPRTNLGVLFFKQKLNIYNFTIQRKDTGEGVNYIWNETIAGKGANEIASCVWMYIHDQARLGVSVFHFYSDNCSNQNKNQMLYSMYLRISKQLNVIIVHR